MFEMKPVVELRCKFGTWLTGLGDDDKANLQVWLDSPETTNRIVRLIREEAKLSFGKDGITAHRTGSCRCSAR